MLSLNNNQLQRVTPIKSFWLVMGISFLLAGCGSTPSHTVSYDEDDDDVVGLSDADKSSKPIKNNKSSNKTYQTPQKQLLSVNYHPSKDAIANPRNDLWQDVFRGFRLGNHTRNPRVSRVVREFSATPKTIQASLARSQPYMHMIVSEIKRRNMPMEVVLVAFVESGFQATAVSRSGASGIWQFMPATGQSFGLPRNRSFDARLDPFASTGAALNYLQKLNRQFKGDWLLAFAAYNAGEGNVMKAISRARQAGRPINFWNLNLPAETMRYVPKILAYKEMLLNSNRYGVRLPVIANTPYLTQVRIEQVVDLRQVARRAGLPTNMLTALNPYFLNGLANPRLSQRIILPKQHANRITMAMRSTPQYSAAVPKPRYASTHSTPQVKRVHTVRVGENIQHIAQRHGVSVHHLLAINHKRHPQVFVGEQLRIA